jgi:hypothetical protein
MNDWLHTLFINEAKPALQRHSGSGGGTAPVEGTAIPVGVPVEKIYFNTALSVEETNAYLSQLTYVQTELFDYPIYVVWACGDEQGTLTGLIVLADITTNHFIIREITIADLTYYSRLYDTQIDDDGSHRPEVNNGYSYLILGDKLWALPCNCILGGVGDKTPLTDLDGLPIGAENEKIKNVLSITPFWASGGNKYKST